MKTQVIDIAVILKKYIKKKIKKSLFFQLFDHQLK